MTPPVRRRQLWLVVFAVAVSATGPGHAQAPIPAEAVEAAYLHKFPGFVDWPPDAFKAPNSPIVIAVAGAPRVLEELTRIAQGRLVLGRAVETRTVSAAELPHDIHVLFVGREAAGEAKALIEDAHRAHVLTVTDLPDGLQAGAVIDFVEVDGRLRFEASLPAARRAEIKLSSRLLSVAARVVEEAR